MNVKPVVLAGGLGVRLWPLSNVCRPKQFLKLLGEDSVFQETIKRINNVAFGAPVVICNEEHRFLAAEQLRELNYSHSGIVLESVGKNTAPAITAAAIFAMQSGSDPILLIMPSDHVIDNSDDFCEQIISASMLAEAGHTVLFGINPEFPHSGYGYIRVGAEISAHGAYYVDGFVEKPESATAACMISTGNYLWNSGIYLVRASQYLQDLNKYHPDIAKWCELALVNGRFDSDFTFLHKDSFEQCPNVSVDIALMERSTSKVVVPAKFRWADIGSWSSLWQVSSKDRFGNVALGDVVITEGKGNYVYSEDAQVAVVGVDNTIVVQTESAILVTNKDNDQAVKGLVDVLAEAGKASSRKNNVTKRPWGKFELIDQGEDFKVKRLTIKPLGKISLQKHYFRSEHWMVVTGRARVTLGEQSYELSKNDTTHVPVGVIHSLENIGQTDLIVIEIQSGDILSEDDIVRLDDKYGRVI